MSNLNFILFILFSFEINSRFNPTELRRIQLKKKFSCKYELLVRIEDFNYVYKISDEQLKINMKINFTENLTYREETIQSSKWTRNKVIIKDNFTIYDKNNIKMGEFYSDYSIEGNFFKNNSYTKTKNFQRKINLLNQFLNIGNNFSQYDLRIEKVACDLDSWIADIKEINVEVKKKENDSFCGIFNNEMALINLDLNIKVDLFKKFHLNIGSDEILEKLCDRDFGKFNKNKLFSACEDRKLKKMWAFN